jgi:hypothetical protein
MNGFEKEQSKFFKNEDVYDEDSLWTHGRDGFYKGIFKGTFGVDFQDGPPTFGGAQNQK